jgi:hypothetical protein
MLNLRFFTTSLGEIFGCCRIRSPRAWHTAGCHDLKSPKRAGVLSVCHGHWRAGAELIWHIANSLEMHDSP